MYIINREKEIGQSKDFYSSVGKEWNNLEKRHEQKANSNSIYAGKLNLISQQQNKIAMKKIQAQKQAMKAIIDKFSKELDMDAGIEEREQHKEQLRQVAKEADGQIKQLRERKEELKEIYGVNDESQEQKDLKLLEKSMDVSQNLTDEEREQLKQMGPLTDYQKDALQYNSMEDIWKKRLEQAQQGVFCENKNIVAIQLERLKSHPMVDAQKEAAQIMENASNEVMGMLVQEGKEHINDKLEEAKEKAEEMEKEKREEEEKQEEKISSDSQSGKLHKINQEKDRCLQELEQFIEKEKVLEEDIKGIMLDEQM